MNEWISGERRKKFNLTEYKMVQQQQQWRNVSGSQRSGKLNPEKIQLSTKGGDDDDDAVVQQQ